MDGNGKLKEINIKNCTCYYFDDIMHNEYWRLYNLEDFDNILIDEKS